MLRASKGITRCALRRDASGHDRVLVECASAIVFELAPGSVSWHEKVHHGKMNMVVDARVDIACQFELVK